MSMLVEQRSSSLKKSRPYSEPALSEDDVHSYPSGIKPELLDAWSLKCAFVVDEIFHTEQDYIESLEGIIQGYRVPLSNHLHSTNEGNRVVGVIFGNIEELYELHQMLLKKLQVHECDPHEFGQVFLQTEDGFKLYTEYCTNYDSALECLQNQLKNSKEMRELILSCQRSLGQPLDLISQLIKPVQRITRYHMLLHQLVKKFNPNHYGYPTLCHAHRAMAEIADHINQVKKQKENAIRVQDIQSYLSGWRGKEAEKNLSAYGELMFESSCKVGKKGAERLVILFEKLLLILKKKDAKRYNYKGHILAKELCVDTDDTDGHSSAFKVFSLKNPNQAFEIQAVSAKKRKEWVARINHLCLVVLKREEEDEEEEYKQFVKRRKTFLGSEMGTGGRPSQPKRSQSEGKIHSRRIPWPRKRSRGDVRQVFHEDGEDEIPITNGISEELSSNTTNVLPPLPESSAMDVIPTDTNTSSSLFDSGHYQLTSSDRQSSEKSMTHSMSDDSLLSLEDVELLGDFDEVDAEERRPRKKRSTPSRRAIKVKRNKSMRDPNTSSLNTSREDGESELSRLMSPPTADPGGDILLDSSMDSDSLYQSGRYSKDSLVDSMSSSGAYQVQIELNRIPGAVESGDHEYGNEEGVVDSGAGGGREDREMEFDSGVVVEQQQRLSGALGATVKMHDDDGQDQTLRRGEDLLGDESGGAAVILEERSESGDIVIMEDSSDSEDEDDETDVLGVEAYQSILSTIEEQGSSVDPPLILGGDQEVPGKEDDSDLHQELSMEESTEMMNGSHDHVDTTDHDRSQPLHDDIIDHTPLDVSLPLQARSDIEVYATLPRRKSHPKPTTPSPRSSTNSTPGMSSGTRYLSSSSTLSRDRPGSKRFRSAQFNQLLEFTRQQASTPVGDGSPVHRQTSASEEAEFELTQSLPISVMGSKSFQQLLESAQPEHDVQSDNHDRMAISPGLIPFATQEEPLQVDEEQDVHSQHEDDKVSDQKMVEEGDSVLLGTQTTENTGTDESNVEDSIKDNVREEDIKGSDVCADTFTAETQAQQDYSKPHVNGHVETEPKQMDGGTDDVSDQDSKTVETIASTDDSKTVCTSIETTTHQVPETDSKKSTPPLIEESVTLQPDVSVVQTAPTEQALTRRTTSQVVHHLEESSEQERQTEPTAPAPTEALLQSSDGVLSVFHHWRRVWGYRVWSYLPRLNVRSGLILVGVALFSSYMIYSGFIGSSGSGRSSGATVSGSEHLSKPQS